MTFASPAMDEVSAVSMEQAAAGTNYDLGIQAIAQNIKVAMTSMLNSPEREAALTNLAKMFEESVECAAPKCVMPKKETFFEILPPQQAETEWASLFVEIVLMWTERTDMNQCIVPEEKPTEIKKALFFEGHHHEAWIECDWLMTYTHGYSTPAILLNIEEPAYLEPNFKGIRITQSDTPFTTKTGWAQAAGEKSPIFYRYESSKAFDTNKVVAESCVNQSEISEYADQLSETLQLSAAEKEMFITELSAQFESTSERKTLSLVDPSIVNGRFDWKLNSEPAELMQLFYEIKANKCEEKTIELPSPEIFETPNRVGLEVGVL